MCIAHLINHTYTQMSDRKCLFSQILISNIYFAE